MTIFLIDEITRLFLDEIADILFLLAVWPEKYVKIVFKIIKITFTTSRRPNSHF